MENKKRKMENGKYGYSAVYRKAKSKKMER